MIDPNVRDDPAPDEIFWRHYRDSLLSQLAAVERNMLHMPFTTADMRLWFSKRGPSLETAIHQVAHIKECGG